MRQLKSLQLADASALATAFNYGFTAEAHKVKSVQIIWTSTTAAFSLTLQYSNDGVNWSDFAAAQAVANNSGSVFHQTGAVDALYFRVAVARTSGTLTTLKAYLAYEAR